MPVGYAGKISRIFVNFLLENLCTVRVNINAHRLHRTLFAYVDFILCVDYLFFFLQQIFSLISSDK